MRKKELTKEQLKERDFFVNHLEKSGWTDTGVNQMFDDGDFVSEESQMEYSGEKMSLMLEFSAKIRGLKFYLTADSGKEATFVIQYEEKLEDILKLITSFQDKISSRNYKSYIDKILDVCPQTFADVPEKGLHQLYKDEKGHETLKEGGKVKSYSKKKKTTTKK